MKRAWGTGVVVFVWAFFLSAGARGQGFPDHPFAVSEPATKSRAVAPARLEVVRLHGLCLLAAPDARAATVRVLRAGEVVRVVSEKGMWAQIEVRGGVMGHVPGGYLTGASGEPPVLYRDRLVTVSRRPDPGDAPGSLLPVAAAPEPVVRAADASAGETATTVGESPAAPAIAGQSASAAPSEASGTPVDFGAMAPDTPATPSVAAPFSDAGGIDRLVAYVVDQLKKPAAKDAADRMADPALREYLERKDRYAIEVYLADCKLVLYERQADGVRRPAKTYTVATPAGDVEAPAGWGVITQIEFEPWWRPTESMKRRARQKGRTLPEVMPPGVKNPMGPFKMHLSHGFAYRIHGNNDPKSIGRRVTNGCIRMRNDEGLELARTLDVGTEVVFRDHAPPTLGQGVEAVVPGP